MRTNFTALVSDRQVLGVWLDDKHIAAEHAALAELKAIEDRIMSPPIKWQRPLLQSLFAEQFMQGWGQQEYKIISVPRGHGKTKIAHEFAKQYAGAGAEGTKALWKKSIENLTILNDAFDYAAVETRAAATMLCDSMCAICDIVDRKNVKETLHAWKKTKPAGGTSPGKRSRQG